MDFSSFNFYQNIWFFFNIFLETFIVACCLTTIRMAYFQTDGWWWKELFKGCAGKQNMPYKVFFSQNVHDLTLDNFVWWNKIAQAKIPKWFGLWFLLKSGIFILDCKIRKKSVFCTLHRSFVLILELLSKQIWRFLAKVKVEPPWDATCYLFEIWFLHIWNWFFFLI